MTIKTLAIAAAATLALATSASAFDAFTFNRVISGSTADLGQVRTQDAGVVSIYDYQGGVQGALLGTEHVSAGANHNVRVRLRRRPIHDVLAVLTVDGQVIDTQELDKRR